MSDTGEQEANEKSYCLPAPSNIMQMPDKANDTMRRDGIYKEWNGNFYLPDLFIVLLAVPLSRQKGF